MRTLLFRFSCHVLIQADFFTKIAVTIFRDATPAEPAAEPIQKKPRKPREKKAAKKNEPVLKTVVQIGNAEFDISDIAQKTYKAYKSTHKRKVVTDFCIYVKPEESAAYYTINGEGSPEMKIEL